MTVTTKTSFLKRLPQMLAVAAVGVVAAGTANADIFEDAGLTGGANRIDIGKVAGSGSLTYSANDYEGGTPQVTDFTGPKATAEISCKRDGYRASRIGDQKVDGEPTTHSAEVESSLAKSKANDAALKAACKAGKTKVQLEVTVTGECRKVKTALGKKKYKVSAPAKYANFELTCDNE
ncbi:MAG: hypothetical protein FJ096_10135 [Deltaproteobacteria bacterium]|nr:hypothetical protein [Deltaproteobacteria bacterium]